MLWTILKWGLPVLAIVAIAGVLTRKTFHVETFFVASPKQVWNVPPPRCRRCCAQTG